MTEGPEVYVDTRYPLPPNVDGLIYYVAEDVPLPASWQTVSPDTVTENPDSGVITTPVPLEVIEQKVAYALGGMPQASAVLVIEDVPYVSDYEIRIVPR